MRYYQRLIDEAIAIKLVKAAKRRMHRAALPRVVEESDDPLTQAQAILARLEQGAPINDCGMSSTITELGLWTREAKALGCGRRG